MIKKKMRTNKYKKDSTKVTKSRKTLAMRTGGYNVARLAAPSNRPELKYKDTAVGVTDLIVAGSISLLNGIQTGTGASERVGKKIQLKSINLKLSVFDETANVGPRGVIFRFLCVYDAQSNGQAFALTDLFEAISESGPIPSIAMYNVSNAERFKVLIDYKASIVNTTSNAFKPLSFYKKINLPVSYGANTSQIGSIQSGSLFALILADSQRGRYLANYRVRYTDA